MTTRRYKLTFERSYWKLKSLSCHHHLIVVVISSSSLLLPHHPRPRHFVGHRLIIIVIWSSSFDRHHCVIINFMILTVSSHFHADCCRVPFLCCWMLCPTIFMLMDVVCHFHVAGCWLLCPVSMLLAVDRRVPFSCWWLLCPIFMLMTVVSCSLCPIICMLLTEWCRSLHMPELAVLRQRSLVWTCGSNLWSTCPCIPGLGLSVPAGLWEPGTSVG